MLFFINFYQGWNFAIVSLAYILVVLITLSLHEFAHAWTAFKCGDMTPKMQGRVSINPFKHIDTIGFLCCAIFGFGWAKPVQYNSDNFRNIKKGIGLTSVAGVLMNLILGFLGCGFFYLTLLIPSTSLIVLFLQRFFYFLFFINISLAVFNVLPIYPLDGFKLVENYTKYDNGYVRFMYRYGSFILLLVLLLADKLLYSLITYVALPIELFWGLFFK